MRSRSIPGLRALALALVLPSLAFLHLHLVKAEPGVDATVTEAPRQIRLWFSEPPELKLTSVTLARDDNTPVATVKMAATDDSLSLAGPVPVALQPGKYVVLWRTGSRDGHAVRGRYSFTYAPPAGAGP
ncbi:MAG TPA: copper resistance CopC family protein [Gemmatimonadales bacterium]|jgi:methionine-rich copper-binding protein CopC|nr:copper resistance CopC family protein [Gemmatimonadales bacterium]